MKRILALTLTIVMLFSLASCDLFQNTDPQETTNESTTPEVTTPEVTTPEVTTPEDTRVTYTVTVVDENDTPLAGATVQLCVGDICRLPSLTNAEGVATFQFDKADYIVKVTLDGYTGEASYSFDAGSNELTVQLTKTSEGTTPDETTPKVDDPITPDFEVSLPEASQVIANIIGAVAASVEVSKDSQFVIVLEQDDRLSGFNGFKQVLFFEVAEAAVDSNGEVLKAHLKVKVGEAVVELPMYGVSENIVVEKDDITSYYEFEISVNGDDISLVANDQNASANLSELVYGTLAQMLGVGDIEGLETMLKTAYIAQELDKNLMPIIAAALGNALEELPTVSPAYSEHLAELIALVGQDIYTVTTDDVTGNTTYSLNLAALKSLLADVENKTLAEYLEGVYGENVVASLSSFLKSLPDKKVKDIVDAAVTLAESTGTSVQEIYALIDMYVSTVTGMEFSIEEQINERYNNTLADLLAEFNGVDPVALKNSFASAAEMLETVSVDALLSSMFMGTNEGFFEAFKATIDQFDEQIVYNFTVDAEGYIVALNYGIGALQYSLVVEGEDSILTVSMPNGAEFVVTVNNEGLNVVVKQNGEQVATGSMTVTEEIDGEDVVTTVVIDLCDDENDLLDYTAVSVNGVLTTINAAIRGYDVWYEGSYNEETGEKFEVRHEEFVEFLTVEYQDLGENGKVLNLYSSGDTIQIAQNGGELTLVVTEGDEVIATGTLSVTETGLSVEVNDTTGQIFQAGIEIIDNAEGEDYVRIEWQDVASVLGYEFNENGMRIAMYDENIEQIFAMLEVVNNAEGESFVHVIWGGEEIKLAYEAIEGGVKVTLSEEAAQSTIVALEIVVNAENELVIDIDLDQILIYSSISETCYEGYYIAFDGAITFKVA